MRYLAGTRGSRLSLAQTDAVLAELKSANPGDAFEAVPMSTRGDRETRPLFAIDQRGIFERDLDRAVAEQKVDFAVHSLKDIPSELPDGLVLACVPRRGPPHDVLVSGNGSSLMDMPHGAILGTSSLRRAVQITRQRPDIAVRPVRGNIDTRIRKIDGKDYDGVVLALAGISRLGLDTRQSILPLDDFVPAPGQGALGIVARKDRPHTISMLKNIEHAESRSEADAERALSGAVDSGCRFPVGAYAKSHGTMLTLRVSAFSIDGSKSITVEKTADRSDPAHLAELAGTELREKGIADLALNWREKVEEWNKQ